MLAPVYVANTSGSAGLLGSAFGVGLVLGAAGFGAVGHLLPRRTLWLAAFVLHPVGLWALGLQPPLPLLLALMMLAGILGGVINPLFVTVRHERIPDALRGQVFSTTAAVATGLQPVGIAFAGASIDRLGFEPTVLLLAIGAQALGVALLFVPTLHALNQTRDGPTISTH
ncbi:MAG: MFS transporter [Chloroflexi bacterium]|nr:MFS transporter [Chloroflexota bacterium]